MHYLKRRHLANYFSLWKIPRSYVKSVFEFHIFLAVCIRYVQVHDHLCPCLNMQLMVPNCQFNFFFFLILVLAKMSGLK